MKEDEDKKKDKRDRDSILDAVNRLSKKAQETAEGKQSNLFENEDLGGEDIGFDANVLNDTVNPELSHRLYYGSQRLLLDNLPSGKKNRDLRRYVYDEKNLFINQGKRINERGRRGSDGRMAPPETLLQEAFRMVTTWVESGGTPFDIFMAFRQRNEELGYYDEKEKREGPIDIDYTDVTFDDQLKGLLSVPPPRKNKKDPE
ncbi:hypothetical protein [Larkinella sp.]|uniref:hypothetical protein n=1 Tax=Larkinella sp. TaxID=2034517 RepID=UPI003BA8D073